MSSAPGEDDAGKDEVYHDLERRYILLQQDHARCKKEGEELQARLTSSTETSAQDKAKITELQQALAARESAVAEQQRAAEGKEHDVRRLTELLARANKELDSNKAFLHVKDEAVTKLEERLRQVTSEKTALETEVLPTRVDVDRLRRELDGCQVRLRDAEAEVNLRLEELNDERKRASSLRLDLENKLNRAESSVSELQERVTGLEGHLRSRDAALQQKEEEVRAQVKQFSEIESRFDAELEAQRRVARLQEEQRKEAFTARDALLQEVQSLKGAYERQLQQQKERLQAQREKYEKLLEELNQEHQERLALLEEELRAERKARAALEKQAPVGASALPQTAAARALASLTQDVSLTERLNQLADLETALHKERSEKERFKFFAQQLTKEIGEKAPILAKERRERDLIAKSYDKVVAQLGQATQDLVSTQRRLQQLGEERETLIAKQRGHDQQVEDLSRQVQLLLHERMKARAAEAGTERAIVLASSSSQRQSHAALPASTNQAASRNLAESLLTFKDVRELQTRNAELLAVVRKLTDEKATHQQEGELALVPAAVQHELGNAHKELKRLGEDREAMRAAVATIASERDMYRLLLVKAESRLLAVGETPPSVQSEQRQPNQLQLPATAEAKSAVAGPSAREVELETKLRDAMDRLGRLEELYNEQVKVCESLRTDVSVARQDATLSKADATFYHERYKRSQEDLDKNREDQQSFMSEVQALRAREHALEKALSEKGHDLEAARDEARRFRISLQQATVEKEVAAGAEKRLEQDLVQKRAEVERLTKVLETSQSLSASLTARTDAEREHLESDRKSLQAQLVAMRNDLHEERAAAEAKVTAQTNEVRVAKAKSEEDVKVLSEQRGEILELKVQLNAANEKAASLLRQLEGTQKRLDSLTTSGTVSAIAVREASEKEMELERLTQEMGEVKAKLAVVEGQRDTFKAASEAHERQMRELQARWEASEKEANETVAKARAEVENLRKRLEEGLETTRAAVQENHGLREAQNQATEAAKKEKQDMLEQLEAARKAAEHAQGREAELLAEANRASETAEMAKEQYRRELQLHAEAEAGMTELRKELETVRGSKAEVDDRLAQVNASALEKERAYATELERLGEASRKEKQRADELQEQNKVMHAQLSVLADHLKKLQEDRVHALGARDGSMGAGAGGAESSGEQAIGGSSAMAEADKLRRAIIDLQGVAHYHRTQKELMEAGKEAAEMEAVRYKSTAQQLQKLLDQSRRELAEERKPRPTPESEREHAALLVQVQEISTLKDALAHIRQEKDRLEKRLRAAEKEVVDLQKAAGPAQQKEQQLEAERKALMAERDSLQQEVTAYSERLSSMVTRFHQIDPEVHRKLASHLEELQKARIPELERQIKEAEAKGLEQGKRAEEAEKKVADLERRAQEGENKAAAALRVTHAAKRQINTLKQESEGLSAEKTRLEGEMATLKAEVESARGEGGTNAAKVKALEEEAARLRVSDAQMKSEITSLKQQAQQQQQQQALAAAKAAAANVPAPSTEPSEQQKEMAKLQTELDAAKGTVQRVKEAGRSALNMVRTWWDGLRWKGGRNFPPDKPSYALHMSHSPWRIGVIFTERGVQNKAQGGARKIQRIGDGSK
jgi:nucleoprotein TPR